MEPLNDKIGGFKKFDKYFSEYSKKRGTRQQRGFTSANRKSQNLVPDSHKIDPTLNQKVETLRNNNTGKLPLNSLDLKYITKTYNITDLSPDTGEDNAKELGTTGIKIYFDNSLNNYVIKK